MAQLPFFFFFFFKLGWTWSNHLGWDEMGWTHSPHGRWLDPATMSIVWPLLANSCNDHHLGGNKRKIRGRLVWQEEKRCWWRSWWWREVQRVAGDGNGYRCAVEEKGKEVADRGEKKLGKRADFFLILASNFFLLNAWNPPLFIGGGRATLYLY